MDLFDLLSLIGGLCLFLFGMNMMGSYLEKSAGEGLKSLLGRLTTGKAAGFFTGLRQQPLWWLVSLTPAL